MPSGKILFITRNYPPLVGGMEMLSWKLTQHLPAGWSLLLAGPWGASASCPPALRVLEAPASPYPLFLAVTLIRAAAAARRYRVDYVVAGSGAVAPLARLAARAAGCGYAVLVHGLDLVIRSRLYRWCFLPSIRAADAVIANSRNTRRLAVNSGVPEARVHVLNPGVDPPPEGGADFRQEFGLGARPVILFLGRLVPRKGLVEFIEHALPAILERIPDAVFVIAGSEPRHALFHKAGVLQRIREAVARRGVAGHVLLTGALADAMADAALGTAEVCVLPLVETPGDVEGFGIVALEAAAHGTPTVAFRLGGVEDAIADGVSGYLVAPGDYAALAGRITGLIAGAGTAVVSADSCRAVAGRFTWDAYAQHLLQVLTRGA